MGSFLRKIQNLSGFTILGDGEIVSILHVPDLILSARMLAESVPSNLRKMKRKVEKQRILVVDAGGTMCVDAKGSPMAVQCSFTSLIRPSRLPS